MSYTSGPVQWRLVIAAQLVIIFLQVGWTAVLPESPRWLAQRGRHAESLHVLSQLAGDGPQSASVTGRKQAIDNAIALETANGPWRLSEAFKSGPLKIRRRYLLAIG